MLLFAFCLLPSALSGARRFLAVLLFAFCLLPFALSGAADAETRAFNVAAKFFQDGFYPRAEREFAGFVQTFPNSPRAADAILWQARARLSQTNAAGAVALLTSNLTRAGQLADQYRFWLGQMRLDSGDYEAAAAEFARLLNEFTNSTRRLEASFGEAQARFKLQEWPRVIELLQKPDGAFQEAARAGGNEELVARGQLLLAEAQFKKQDYRAAEATAGPVPTHAVEIAWARQFLLCRLELATEREELALRDATNLLALAAATGQPRLQAESFALQGAILEELQEYDDAIRAYEQLQAENMPEDQRRDAFLKIVELMLTQESIPQAAARLEKFLAVHPEDSASDDVLLTLGELRLKEHLASLADTNAPATNNPAVPATNRLQQAILCFEQLPQKYPQSPRVGKAHLDRGWALLADGKIVEAQAAFKLAAAKLPFSEDQAIARFKLADTQFLQNDLTNALAGYRKLIDDYGGLPRIRTGLFDRAWYQIGRVCLQLGDRAGAEDAMSKILLLYPATLYSGRILLLLGQDLSQAGQPAKARALFTEFTRTITNSALLPEVQMALARSYELENRWPEAIHAYDGVLARFRTNAIAPRAEFLRALANDHAGRETNALNALKKFLVRFPTNEYAPRAQDWMGDFYFRNEDYVEAERIYQWTNWPAADPIRFQARFKAGRAAFMRQGYDDAITYFLSLINDKQCPTNLLAEAFFAYGDAITNQPLPPTATNRLAKWETAIDVFAKIPQQCAKDPATAPTIARAWGRIADCWFQLASQDSRRYTNALESYEKALASPQADLATRSQAEIGLANVLAKQAQLKVPPDAALFEAALGHYLNVVYGKNLREDEAPIPLWVKEAGFAAARLLEARKQPDQAVKVYLRLQQLIPSLRPTLEKRIKSALEPAAARPEGPAI